MLLRCIRPAVEIHEGYFSIGKRIVPWMDVRRLDILRLDRADWISPLVMRITLFDDTRFTLIYPGDIEACSGLLRNLRRLSRDALIDGVPYRQYWGEVLASGGNEAAGPRYRLLRPEDEAEVERLYQRLKWVGHLDPEDLDGRRSSVARKRFPFPLNLSIALAAFALLASSRARSLAAVFRVRVNPFRSPGKSRYRSSIRRRRLWTQARKGCPVDARRGTRPRLW